MSAPSPRKPKPKAAKKRTYRSLARSSPLVGAGLARLGKRVRRLRMDKGLSQEDAADRAAIDPKHFQLIETGQVNVTFASLVGVAKALGVKLAELFRGV